MNNKKTFGEKVALICQQIITYSFFLLVFFVPLIFTTQNYESFEFPKMLLVYAAAAIVGFSWLGKMITEGKLSWRPSVFFLPLIAFLLSNIASTILSVDRHTSVFGYYTRFNGGLLSTIAYLILFFAFVSNLNRANAKRFLLVGTISALLVSIWGIPSHFGYDPTCKLVFGKWISSCWVKDFDPTKRIFSTLGQPNWLAAYLAFYLPLTFVFLFAAKNQVQKFFFFVSANLIYWAFLLTNSRAAALGLVIGFLIFWPLYFLTVIRTGKRNLSIQIKTDFNGFWLLTTFLTFLLITFSFGSQLLGRIGETLPQRSTNQKTVETQIAQNPPTTQPQPKTETSLLTGGTESGKIRLIVWRGAIEIFKNYPIFGSGVETFAYTYYNYRPQEHNLTTEWNLLYNKAHNEYLNYLATTGAVGFLSYMAVIFVFLFAAGKFVLKIDKKFDLEKLPNSKEGNNQAENLKNKLIIIGLLAGYIAYLVQNFFGFSVVTIALLFFLFPAVFVVLTEEKPKQIETIFSLSFKKIKTLTGPFVFILATGALFSIYLLLRIWQSDVLFAKSNDAQAAENYQSAYLNLKNAISLLPYHEPMYFSDLGFVSANLASEEEDKKSREEYFNTALTSTKTAVQSEPFNLNFWRQASKTYLLLSQFDSGLEKNSLEAIYTAAVLAPTEPDVWYQKALTEKVLGFDASASASLKHSLELKPDFAKASDKLSEWQKK